MKTLNNRPVSRFCFGCMQFGGTADESASRGMFEACRAKGINFFDTAFVYTEGLSETYLGAFIAHERDDIIVATKAAYTGGSGRENILRSFDISRTRLSIDMADVLYLHRWDDETPLEETFETLAEMQGKGAFRYIGVSNFSAWQVVKAQAVAAQFDTRIDIFQPMYSLVKRQAEVEILPMARAEGIAIAPYSPLGGGLLTGKYARGGTGRLSTDARYAARYGQDWMYETAKGLNDIAEARGLDPATLAVAWVAHHSSVTAPIISARSAEQLAPSLAAMDIVLNAAEYDALSALSPAPPPATDRLEEA